MEVYLESIKAAILIFPILAFLITIPYLTFEYHKYGSVPFLRSSIVYTFILYLLIAYFLVILPLPDKEQVLLMKSRPPQLIPFTFIGPIINAIKVSSNFNILTKAAVYTVLFNLILTVPFGIYLRYYFNKKWYQVLILTFLLSLFFELTQLTGLYGIYPKAYRLFDIDDLIINTLGGMLGFLITPLVTKILPNRKNIDEMSYKRGLKVSIYRRLIAYLIDIVIFAFIYIVILIFTNFSKLAETLLVLIFFYYVLPVTISGKTIGKYIVKIKVISKNKRGFFWIFIRQIMLYYLLVFPKYLIILSNIEVNNKLFTVYLIIIFVIYLKIFLKFLGKKSPLLYEKVTSTENISTIKYEFEPGQTRENMVECKQAKEVENEN